MIKLTKRAQEEVIAYKLSQRREYYLALSDYTKTLEQRKLRYGTYGVNDVPTRNMVKALRMMPWQNTGEDWARLHVYEAAIRSKE